MEELLKLSHDYSVEALKLYQILKTENSESYLGRKIMTNGIDLGLQVRGEKSEDKIKQYVTEMKYLLEVICDADYLSRETTETLNGIAEKIEDILKEENW